MIWQINEIASLQNGKLTNGKLMKWQVDEMAS
jgi:hypothetical protein